MSQQTCEDLVPVHGGLSEPVDRVVPLNHRSAFLAEAEGLSSVEVDAADLSTVYRLSDGALSPLDGPMREAVWHRVLDAAVIESSGKDYAWTIPIALPLTDAEAASAPAGGSVAVRDETGRIVAIVDEIEVYDWDKARYVSSV
jgi:sulfate adenylyltransferase